MVSPVAHERYRRIRLTLLATHPCTAVAIIRFGLNGVGPASRAFRAGHIDDGIRIIGNTVFGPGGYARLPDARKEQVHGNRLNVKAEVLGSGFASLDPAATRTMVVPTLLVTGEKSISLFQRLVGRLHELMPQAETVAIPGASHMMHEDNAIAFNHAVCGFLERQKHAV